MVLTPKDENEFFVLQTRPVLPVPPGLPSCSSASDFVQITQTVLWRTTGSIAIMAKARIVFSLLLLLAVCTTFSQAVLNDDEWAILQTFRKTNPWKLIDGWATTTNAQKSACSFPGITCVPLTSTGNTKDQYIQKMYVTFSFVYGPRHEPCVRVGRLGHHGPGRHFGCPSLEIRS